MEPNALRKKNRPTAPFVLFLAKMGKLRLYTSIQHPDATTYRKSV
ncbi:hypothetical protein ACFSKT_00175 [Paenibacillus xanthanilyticus]